MPSSRLTWKLLLIVASASLLSSMILGGALAHWQSQRILGQYDQRLRNAAHLVRNVLSRQMLDHRADLQSVVRALAQQTPLRFTLVDAEGQVLADSVQDSPGKVSAMEDHRNRPEIMRALAGDEGSVVRESETLGAIFKYHAVPVESGGRLIGVLRVGVPVSRIDRETHVAKRWIWGLVLGAALAGLVILYPLLRYILRPLPALTEASQAIASGDYDHRVYVANRDELGQLGRTLNRIGHDLKLRMSQLLQTTDRQSTVLGGMVEGVIAVDERQRVVLANRAAGRLFEFRPEGAVGRPLLEVVRDHALHQAVTTAIFTRQAQRVETRREGSDRLIADVHVNPLPGTPCPGVVLVMHDTTELHRLESLRRDFVTNASHELKTPLSSIKAYAETLRNGAIGDPEASDKFLGRIEEQADRLHRLILDMLTIARIESAQQVFEIVSVDVGEAADTCVEDCRQAAEAKNIRLSVEANQSPCSVRADREGLREILNNLVDNAIKYTPPGGAVVIRWRCDHGVCRLEVEDTGIGIGDEDRKRVFERFYRVDKARSRELGGTGLGLSIVKHLSQAFGGKVSVASEPGIGSTFSVELPMAE